MNGIEFFYLIIGSPDRRKTCGLCCHNVHTDSEIYAQVCNTRSNELHHFIFNIASVKNFSDNRKRNVLWADTLLWCSCQINSYYARHINIVSLAQQLFYKLRSTLSDCHRTECTVTCVGVRTQNHLAAACKHLSCKLVNDCLMRWHVNTAVFFRAGKSKHVVIFVDGSTYCT